LSLRVVGKSRRHVIAIQDEAVQHYGEIHVRDTPRLEQVLTVLCQQRIRGLEQFLCGLLCGGR
jgi:hypothetical protein